MKRKAGTLKSGRSGKKVKSRKQAIAFGLSEARKRGAKVPKKKGLNGVWRVRRWAGDHPFIKFVKARVLERAGLDRPQARATSLADSIASWNPGSPARLNR
jgi:Family of unknown function (DUF6496)